VAYAHTTAILFITIQRRNNLLTSITTSRPFMTMNDLIKTPAPNAALAVKVGMNGELRRFPFEGYSFDQLCARIAELFGLAKDTPLVVHYTDDEGDKIIMSSDLEFKEAAGVSKGGVLRLQVSCNAANVAEVKTTEAPQNPPAFFPKWGQHKEWMQNKEGIQSWKERKMMWREQKKLCREQWKQCKAPNKDEKAPEEGKLVARHVKDVTIEDGTEIPPNTPFTKTWSIRNEGGAWPAGCRLMYISRHGDKMGGPDFVPVPVEGPVQPGQVVDISVPLVSPSQPGRYNGFWRLCTAEGRKFGQRLWVSIVVPSNSSSDENKVPDALAKYQELADVVAEMGFDVKKHIIVRLLNKTDGDVDKVVKILTKRGKALKKM
jgi:hypothetical protein